MSQSDLDGILYVLRILYPEFDEGFLIWQQFMLGQFGSAEMNGRLETLKAQAKPEERMKCPRCEGEGKYVDYEDTCFAQYFRRCQRCGGKGYLWARGEE